jgi:hypothetical membrane protein
MPRRADAAAATLAVLLFWIGILTAGAQVSGYSATDDYISNLASRRSPVGVLALAALLASAAAHVVSARLIRERSRVLAAFLLAAAAATVCIAAFRQSCPGGPAGCSRAGAPNDWIDAAHTLGVAAYQVLVVAAMLTVAFGALRRTGAWPSRLGLLSVGFVVGSMVLLSLTGADDPGLWQRLWVANNLTWLLVVAWVAAA